MRLGTLLGSDSATPVTGFAIDHRKVAPGNIFGAFKGSIVNGEDFIPAAIASGAIAVVATPEAKVVGAVHVADIDPRRAFALLAARYFSRENVERTGILNPDAVSELWSEHLSGRKDNGRPLWCVLNFLIWFDLFVYNGDYKKYLVNPRLPAGKS